MDDIVNLLGEELIPGTKLLKQKVWFLEKNCTLFSGIIEKIDKE
ncbi:MAG: hypothetical protein R2883_08640 [Caldisericia bacterium]